MAKKKATKKVKKKTAATKKEVTKPKITKKIKEKENRQLLWFFFWIALIFALFLGTYFFLEGTKKFEYAHAEWTIEEYEQLTIYHGRFLVFDGRNLNYNIYLRQDPRENNVSTNGDFSFFKRGGYLSISPEADNCRSDFSRAVVDLAAFLKTGVGVTEVEIGTNDLTLAEQQGKPYVDCATHPERTVIILEKGTESYIEQNAENPFCYTISVSSCSDTKTIEKFMVKAIDDFKERY